MQHGYIERTPEAIADILVREGIDYVQSKAVFRAARLKAGLHAPKEKRNAPARLTLDEQLRFIDAAYARSGQTGLMVQTLLETGKDVEDELAGGRGSVESFLKADQVDAMRLEVVDGLEKLPQ